MPFIAECWLAGEQVAASVELLFFPDDSKAPQSSVDTKAAAEAADYGWRRCRLAAEPAAEGRLRSLCSRRMGRRSKERSLIEFPTGSRVPALWALLSGVY